MQSNTFDEILGLEEQFYDDGYQQGLADGIKSGRIEGRTFGLEKGFEKYIESGRLYGKSLVWANRTPELQKKKSNSPNQPSQPSSAAGDASGLQDGRLELDLPRQLPQLPDNARLAKHIRTLHALAESESLSTENTEDAVSDFDDRFKRAQAKSKIIERMAGETKGDSEGQGKSSNDGSIEDVSVLSARH